jgi:hypothetical protein
MDELVSYEGLGNKFVFVQIIRLGFMPEIRVSNPGKGKEISFSQKRKEEL